MVDKGNVRENVSADITDTPANIGLGQCICHVSRAAGNGHTSIRNLESLPYTTIADESDTRLSSCTRCSSTTCQLICVSYKMEGKMGDGQCR